MTIRYSKGLRSALAGPVGFAAAFDRGVIEVRTGSQPADANSPAVGTLLGTITQNGAAFTPGSPTNGLTFGAPVDGSVGKSGVWSFTGIAAGTAGHFRFKANAIDNGEQSNTAVRLDGSCGPAGSDLVISNSRVAVGAPNTVDEFSYTVPEA